MANRILCGVWGMARVLNFGIIGGFPLQLACRTMLWLICLRVIYMKLLLILFLKMVLGIGLDCAPCFLLMCVVLQQMFLLQLTLLCRILQPGLVAMMAFFLSNQLIITLLLVWIFLLILFFVSFGDGRESRGLRFSCGKWSWMLYQPNFCFFLAMYQMIQYALDVTVIRMKLPYMSYVIEMLLVLFGLILLVQKIILSF